MGELLRRINNAVVDCENRKVFNMSLKLTHEELMELRRLLMVDEFNSGLREHNYKTKVEYFNSISK